MTRVVALIWFAFLAATTPGLSQERAILKDSARTFADFDTARLHAYAADPQYRYERHVAETSWLGALWKQLLARLRDIFSEGGSLTSRVFQILLVCGALFILLYFFYKSPLRNIFARGDSTRQQEIRILDATVPKNSVSAIVDKALSAGEYRVAFRWAYIDLLQKLAANKTLVLHRNKTNRDYKTEFNVAPLRPAFMQLADAFDYVWYGEYPIDRQAYDRYATLIQTVLRQHPP